jgi:hypothetical protein
MTESERESERLAGTLEKVKVSEGKAGHQRAGRQAGRQVKRPGMARQVCQREAEPEQSRG